MFENVPKAIERAQIGVEGLSLVKLESALAPLLGTFQRLHQASTLRNALRIQLTVPRARNPLARNRESL